MEGSAKKKTGLSRRDFFKSVGGGAAGLGIAARTVSGKPPLPPDLDAASETRITLTVNGRKRSLRVEARETLLDVLRDRLRLTGAKRVCNRGECGGCTVLLDGAPIYSCHTLAVQADGRSVQTVEGLAAGGKLHPLQQAFIDKDGYQCGYCTPGFLMSSAALLARTPSPTENEIRAALSGNLCRCGNFRRITASVAAAAETMRRG